MSVAAISSTSTGSLSSTSGISDSASMSSSSSKSTLAAEEQTIRAEIFRLQKEDAIKNAQQIRSLSAQLVEIEAEIAEAEDAGSTTTGVAGGGSIPGGVATGSSAAPATTTGASSVDIGPAYNVELSDK